MQTVTVDTNCLIDLERSRQPHSDQMQAIVRAFANGRLDLTVAAISASENQQKGRCRPTYDEFLDLLARLGLRDARVLKPMGYWGVSFWGQALWVSDDMKALEGQVHEILPPHGIPLESPGAEGDSKWRNKKCDVQLVWSHIWHGTDTLITRDGRILSKAGALAGLGCSVVPLSAFAGDLGWDLGE